MWNVLFASLTHAECVNAGSCGVAGVYVLRWRRIIHATIEILHVVDRFSFEKCVRGARYIVGARPTNGFIVKINIRSASLRAERAAPARRRRPSRPPNANIES